MKDFENGEGLSGSEDENFETCHFALSVADPISYQEAAQSDAWVEAMNYEINSIIKNQTWELVALPEGRKIVGVKWLFIKTKSGPNGCGVKIKARLVAKGYLRQPGIDYQLMFAHVSCFKTIRLMIVVAASKGWSIHQLDVK